MLRRLLKSCLLLVLVVLIGVASVKSQTIGAYTAHIPFDFTVANNDYPAGDYTVSLRRVLVDDTAILLTLRDAKGAVSQATVAMKNGNMSRNDTADLVFNRFGENQDIYVMKQIVAPEFGYSVRSSKTATSVKITKNFGKKPETVAVLLTPQK